MSASSWAGRKVLVTGGEGFIGSTLVDHLLALGAGVRAYVHYKPYGSAGYLAGREDDVEIVAGDVRDGERLSESIRGCDTVFHLAALIGIPYSYVAPESYIQTNVIGTLWRVSHFVDDSRLAEDFYIGGITYDKLSATSRR